MLCMTPKTGIVMSSFISWSAAPQKAIGAVNGASQAAASFVR